MVRKPTTQDYMYWALNYPVPQHEQSGEYVYYYPFYQQDHQQSFQYSPSPFSISHLQASRLVSATMRTRVQLALEYHQATDAGKAVVWSRADETGELIDWYENIGLWGATAFSARAGKMGTVLARTRELLIERALHQGGMPRPNALTHVRQLPGMEEISPVLLLEVQGHDPVREIRQCQDPALDVLQRYDLQVASDREPLFLQEHLPSEWLVTLLYEDRSMVTYHASPKLPTVVQVLHTLFSRMRCLEDCSGSGEWMGDEDMPYTVCERQQRDLKALLATAYSDFLLAFGNACCKGGKN